MGTTLCLDFHKIKKKKYSGRKWKCLEPTQPHGTLGDEKSVSFLTPALASGVSVSPTRSGVGRAPPSSGVFVSSPALSQRSRVLLDGPWARVCSLSSSGGHIPLLQEHSFSCSKIKTTHFLFFSLLVKFKRHLLHPTPACPSRPQVQPNCSCLVTNH